MEKTITELGLNKQKKLISNCSDLKQLSCYIQEIESELIGINTEIRINQIKFKEGNEHVKGNEWYRLKISKKGYLSRLKYLLVQRIAVVKAEEKANFKPLEKQVKVKKLSDYFVQIANVKLDREVYDSIMNEAKRLRDNESIPTIIN